MSNAEFKAMLALDVIEASFEGRFFTAAQLARKLGVSYDTALNRLKTLYQLGKVGFYEVQYSSRVTSYNWYGVTEK